MLISVVIKHGIKGSMMSNFDLVYQATKKRDAKKISLLRMEEKDSPLRLLDYVQQKGIGNPHVG
jgi:hypothetical protein